MKIFLWRYIIRTSWDAASLVAAPTEAATGVSFIWLEATNRRYWWVGIEDVTSSLLTPNCNTVDIYLQLIVRGYISAPGCLVSDQMCSLKKVSSAFLYINGFFLSVICQTQSKMYLVSNVQALQSRMSYLVVVIVTDCAYHYLLWSWAALASTHIIFRFFMNF